LAQNAFDALHAAKLGALPYLSRYTQCVAIPNSRLTGFSSLERRTRRRPGRQRFLVGSGEAP
jgi:hypothetical protein